MVVGIVYLHSLLPSSSPASRSRPRCQDSPSVGSPPYHPHQAQPAPRKQIRTAPPRDSTTTCPSQTVRADYQCLKAHKQAPLSGTPMVIRPRWLGTHKCPPGSSSEGHSGWARTSVPRVAVVIGRQVRREHTNLVAIDLRPGCKLGNQGFDPPR